MIRTSSHKIIGNTVFSFDRVKSTNDIAAILAEKGFDEGTVVSADFQSKGRGRMGRKWQSPDGENIFLSVILRPEKITKNIGLLSLMAAYAVFKTVRSQFENKVFIKWPNDVLTGDKKLAGILLEMKSKGNNVENLILGIGLNVNSNLEKLDVGLREKATSISLLKSAKVNKNMILGLLLNNLDEVYNLYKNEEFETITAFINANLYLKDKSCRFLTGSDDLNVIIKGINTDGSLLVIHNNRSRSFHTGEIIT